MYGYVIYSTITIVVFLNESFVVGCRTLFVDLEQRRFRTIFVHCPARTINP